jgi:hypothetical protein
VTDIVEELRKRHRNTTGLDPRITNPIVGPTIFFEAADEIERLRVIVQGWEHSARNAERDMETLRAERDEARRMYCGRVSRDVPLDAFEIAKNHEWDCFKEDGNE